MVVAAVIALCGGVLSWAPAHADALRCGSRLALAGDRRDAVRNKCGVPTEMSHQTIPRRPSFFRHGRVYFLSDELNEVPVKIWTYNLGPNKFMRRLRFVDGLLEDIETLEYGYHEDN